MRYRWLGRLSLAFVLLATAWFGMAQTAAALPGPSSLTLGLADDQLFASGSPTLSTPWLQRASALGSSFVRIGALWSNIAPYHLPAHFRASDPRASGYDWRSLDASVRLDASHGQQILILVHDAPIWAERSPIPSGVQAGTWYPSASQFSAFAHALAARYSGHFKAGGTVLPRVRYFQAWNEPNLPNYIMPQFLETSGGAFIAESPIIYRSLLNAFYRAVKKVQRDSVVLSAGTAPYGDVPGQGQGRMYPVTFLDGLFCLTAALRPLSCPSPPHFDVLDHHPYSNTPLAGAKVPSNIGVPNLNRVYRILHAAERFGHVRPAGPKPLWITEIDWTALPATPPVLALQARYLALGLYVLWRQGISHVFWFSLRDPVGSTNSFRDSGLYFDDGVAKPAAAAFRFPFAALRLKKRYVALWGKAPGPGPVFIDRRVGTSWKQAFRLRPTSGRIFYAQRRFNPHWLLRARQGGFTSPSYSILG